MCWGTAVLYDRSILERANENIAHLTYLRIYWKYLQMISHFFDFCGIYLTVWYLPVQRSQITIKGVYYDEKPAVLHFQVVHVITFGMIIMNHFQKWHIAVWVAVSQGPEVMEWKRDDELEILSKHENERCIQRAKSVSNTYS